MQRSIVLSELRVRVTGASVDYVGSVTIHEELCDALGLLERQMVHIRNQRSGVDLWTYVIRGHDSPEVPPGTLCLNGAAAHLVKVGDVVTITARGMLQMSKLANDEDNTWSLRRWDAVQNGVTNVVESMGVPPATWAKNVVLEYACGKVHRPRITNVVTGEENVAFPALYLDEDWAKEGGFMDTEAVHLVNVTSGQRDIITVRYARKGSKQCALHMGQPDAHSMNGYGSRSGYQVGDVIIAMNYGYIPRGTIVQGGAPAMQICFPFERPNKNPDGVNLYQMWDKSTKQHANDVVASS